jgi:hypothetical protein
MALRPRLSTDLPFRSIYLSVFINNINKIVNKNVDSSKEKSFGVAYICRKLK